MLGPRIAVLRREAGLSQAELARRLKISPSAMGMYEQGRREPSAEILVAMARELDVSTDYLLTGQPRTAAESERTAQAILSRVDDTQRKLDSRRDRPFSRQELAVLFAALLMEP